MEKLTMSGNWTANQSDSTVTSFLKVFSRTGEAISSSPWKYANIDSDSSTCRLWGFWELRAYVYITTTFLVHNVNKGILSAPMTTVTELHSVSSDNDILLFHIFNFSLLFSYWICAARNQIFILLSYLLTKSYSPLYIVKFNYKS